jgi:hypothetical protein
MVAYEFELRKAGFVLRPWSRRDHTPRSLQAVRAGSAIHSCGLNRADAAVKNCAECDQLYRESIKRTPQFAPRYGACNFVAKRTRKRARHVHQRNCCTVALSFRPLRDTLGSRRHLWNSTRARRLCLNINQNSRQSGGGIIPYPCGGFSNMEFNFVDLRNGYYAIQTVNGSSSERALESKRSASREMRCSLPVFHPRPSPNPAH